MNPDENSLETILEKLTSMEQRRKTKIADEFNLLHRVSELAASGSDLQEFFEYIVEEISNSMNVAIVSLMLIDWEEGQLRIRAAKGLPKEVIERARVRLGSSIAGRVAQEGRPFLINNVEEYSDLGISKSKSRYTTPSLLSVPIRSRSLILGVINVNNKLDNTIFNDTDLDLLSTISNQAGLAIENVMLINKMKEQWENQKHLLDEMRRQNELKNDLVINLSHEIKTPLNAIVGYVDLLLNRVMDEWAKDLLSKILQRSLHLNRITDQMIHYFALQSKALHFNFVSTPPISIIKSVAEKLSKLAAENEVKIEIEPVGLQSTVMIDENLFTQAIEALMDNGIRFNKKKGRVIISGHRAQAEGADMLTIRIEDTGPGINPALHSILFEPFRQTSDIMENKPDGLGLGLPIAEAIITAHHGTLKLLRSDSNGTVFGLTMPIG